MKTKIKKLKNAFSIIEIIIYLAIFTIVSIVVINSFIIVLSSFTTIRINHDLLGSGSMAMERISREIRQASSIDVVNTTSEVLQLNSTDSSGNIVVIKFAKEGDALNIYKDGNIVGNILASNIILNSISFDRIVTTKGEGLKIKIVLQNTGGKIERIENFYNTVVLRGGY